MVMLSDQHLYPLSLGLYTWNSSATVSPEYYPLVVIGSLLAVVPLIVAFVTAPALLEVRPDRRERQVTAPPRPTAAGEPVLTPIDPPTARRPRHGPDAAAAVLAPGSLAAWPRSAPRTRGLVLDDFTTAAARAASPTPKSWSPAGAARRSTAGALDAAPRLRAVVHTAGHRTQPHHRRLLGARHRGLLRRRGQRRPRRRVHPRHDPARRQARPGAGPRLPRRARAATTGPRATPRRATTAAPSASSSASADRPPRHRAAAPLRPATCCCTTRTSRPRRPPSWASGPVELAELFAASDVVSVHTPLLPADPRPGQPRAARADAARRAS